MAVTNTARDVFRRWRQNAQSFMRSNPPAVLPRGDTLQEVVNRWRRFARDGRGPVTGGRLLDVLYNLLPWLPQFQDDPEHQVYLEAISRAAAQAAAFSPYRALILRDAPHQSVALKPWSAMYWRRSPMTS